MTPAEQLTGAGWLTWEKSMSGPFWYRPGFAHVVRLQADGQSFSFNGYFDLPLAELPHFIAKAEPGRAAGLFNNVLHVLVNSRWKDIPKQDAAGLSPCLFDRVLRRNDGMHLALYCWSGNVCGYLFGGPESTVGDEFAFGPQETADALVRHITEESERPA